MKFIRNYQISLPLIVASLSAILILFFPKFLPSKLPLFYSLPWGDMQLADNKQFLIIPAMILIVSLVNLQISYQLHPQQLLLKRILLTTSLLVSAILLITLIQIIMIFI